MLSEDDKASPAAPAEQEETVRRKAEGPAEGDRLTSSSKRHRPSIETGDSGGEQPRTPEAPPPQTPPPGAKPIYFITEYVPDEHTVMEVNAGGRRYHLPVAALEPLARTPRITGVPSPRRVGDLFLDVSPLVFEPLARLLVLPPPTHLPSLFDPEAPCPRPPPLPRGMALDPMEWHLTLAALGLCKPPTNATVMADKDKMVAAKEKEEEEPDTGAMSVVRAEEEVGATEFGPRSDPLVDIHLQNGGQIQTRASTLMQGPADTPIRRELGLRLRHAPLRVYMPGPPLCVSLLVDHLRLRAMASRLEETGAVTTAPCPVPTPHVQRHLLGDWERLLSLAGLREWVEDIKAPRMLFRMVHMEDEVPPRGLRQASEPLLLPAPHTRAHVTVAPPLKGHGVYYLRLRPHLLPAPAASPRHLPGPSGSVGAHITLTMRSVDHPRQRQWTISVAGNDMDLFPMGEAVVLKADLVKGRLEARRAGGGGVGFGAAAQAAVAEAPTPLPGAGARAGDGEGSLAAGGQAWALEGKGELAPADHPEPGEGLQLEVTVPPRPADSGTLCLAFERVTPADYWSGWGNIVE